LLCPARLEPWEGHEYLLLALASLLRQGIPFECDIAGDGSLSAELKRCVDALGLSANVSLFGRIPDDILQWRLKDGFYDVVATAGVDDAGRPDQEIPEALLHAMALGIPCIATRTPDVADLIDDSECTVAVPQRDAAALSAAIAQFALQPQRRAEVGSRARRRIHDAFDVRSTTVRLCELMEA
jgi:glycosyltransferase involved in cell wall biosynthesis